MAELDIRVRKILDGSDFNSLPLWERKKIIRYNREQQILTISQAINKDHELTTAAWRRKMRDWLYNCVVSYERDYGGVTDG